MTEFIDSPVFLSDESSDSELLGEDTRYAVFSFVRDGETAGSELDILEGRLTHYGQYQAKTLGEEWKNTRIDVLYSSDQAGALETAAYIAKVNCGNPTIKEELFLRDQNHGSEAVIKEGCHDQAQQLQTNQCDGSPASLRDFRPPCGESLNDMVNRGLVWILSRIDMHGVRSSNPITDLRAADELPEGIPHIVCVTHSLLLCELFEALECWHEEKHRSQPTLNYRNTGWTRHLIGFSGKRDRTQEKDENASLAHGSYARKFGIDLQNKLLASQGFGRIDIMFWEAIN